MDAKALQRHRAKHRPPEIKVLFIGESPPAGGTFFYNADSNLYQYTRESFARVYPEEGWAVEGFLGLFRSMGCYLDDLCHEPVNGLEPVERQIRRRESVVSLSRRIRRARPGAVVCLMQAIEGNVRGALARSQIGETAVYSLPFPAQGHQRKYVAGLVATLSELIALGVLPEPLSR